MSEADLQTVVRSAVVFYRVSPRHKVRIVKAVQVQMSIREYNSIKCQ